MGTFPEIRYTEATLSGRSANAIANLDVRRSTNAGAISQAISNIGEVAGDIGLKIQAAEDASELSTINRKLHENWNAEYNTLQTTQDPEQRMKIHQKAVRDRTVIANSSKRQNIIRAAQIKINNYEPQFNAHFNNLDRTMRIGKIEDDLNLNIASAIQRGNLDEVKKSVGLAVSTGAITDSKAELLLLKAQKDIAKIQKENDKNITYQYLVGIAAKDGWDKALEQINDPKFQKEYNLDIDSAGDLTTRIKQQKDIAEAQAKAAIEKDNQEIGDLILEGDPTAVDRITNSSLPYEQKKAWLADIREKTGRNETVYNDLLTKVSQEPDKYDSTYLAGFITKGINTDDFKELNGILTSAKTKDNYQKIVHRQYVNAINDMQTRRLFNSGSSEQDKLDNINKSTQAMIAIENWSKNNPNATSAQYEEFFKVLTMPNIDTYGSRISGSERQEILDNTGIDVYDGFDFFGLISGEEGIKAQAEITKKKQELINQDVAENSTVRMVSPDGKEFDVPMDKKQKFIDNGYKVR